MEVTRHFFEKLPLKIYPENFSVENKLELGTFE